jgi:ribokinase
MSVPGATGAGDCFNGGLAAVLARGDELPAAVRLAAACGALGSKRMYGRPRSRKVFLEWLVA